MTGKRKSRKPLVLLTALLTAVVMAASWGWVQPRSAYAAELGGKVQGAGSPIAGSTVTLYAASEGGSRRSSPKAKPAMMGLLVWMSAPIRSRALSAKCCTWWLGAAP
jgi:hypothetical protein